MSGLDLPKFGGASFEPKPARCNGYSNSVIDNGLAGILPCGAVAWTARALLAGCALAGYVKAYSASNKAARGAVGAYQRRGGAV